MSGEQRFGWSGFSLSRTRRCSSVSARCRATSRRLAAEPLEDRRLLTITVDTLLDEADGSIVDGDVSLRDAIALAPVGETIDFAVAGAINLELGELLIDKDLTIDGPGANMLMIDAGGNSRVFNVDDGLVDNSDVSISGLTITGGQAPDDGGGIR